MDKEKIIQLLWKDHHVRGRKCPRNHIAISLGIREALLDMRTFQYSNTFRYRKALKIYNSLCKEREERNMIEHLVDQIIKHENNNRINQGTSIGDQRIVRTSE